MSATAARDATCNRTCFDHCMVRDAAIKAVLFLQLRICVGGRSMAPQMRWGDVADVKAVAQMCSK